MRQFQTKKDLAEALGGCPSGTVLVRLGKEGGVCLSMVLVGNTSQKENGDPTLYIYAEHGYGEACSRCVSELTYLFPYDPKPKGSGYQGWRICGLIYPNDLEWPEKIREFFRGEKE